MRVGVVSDTHDQVQNIQKAVERLNAEGVDLVIHCGDWVAPFTLAFYKELRAPMKGVFGNNDGDRFLFPIKAKDFGVQVEFEERVLSLVLGERKVFVYHGDYGEVTEALLMCGKYDAVFHGHTHQRVNMLVGDTLSLNPGTFMPYTDEKTQGASFAIYETSDNSARFIDL